MHATLRVRKNLPSLRRAEAYAVVEAALRGVLGRDGFAVVHYSVQANHVHLLVEARDAAALARGMQAFAIRVARGLNARLGRRGVVWSDRYHARALRTPREVRNGLCYVLQNARRHGTREVERSGAIVAPTWLDPRSSAAAFDGWAAGPWASERPDGPAPPVAPASSWLLTAGWRRHGAIRSDEVPAAAWG